MSQINETRHVEFTAEVEVSRWRTLCVEAELVEGLDRAMGVELSLITLRSLFFRR